MDVKDAADSLKEWFFDLAGIFLPGATLMFVLTLIYNNQVHLSDVGRYYSQDLKVNFAYVVTAYITGYLVYSLSAFVDTFFDVINRLIWNKIPSKDYSQRKILSSSNEYSLFKKLSVQKAPFDTQTDLTAFLQEDRFEEIRNLAMSYSPVSDSKIYNFSFRAEICNHLGTAFIITGVVGIIASIATSHHQLLFSLCSFVVAVLFKLVRVKYLDAAYKVPFSIANVKLMTEKS